MVAEITTSGVHVGTHPRMAAPTGRSFETLGIIVLRVVDGKIVEIRGLGDRLTMFLQLGWDWPTEP